MPGVNIFLLLTALVTLGAFAGVLAGLLGVGGGLVIVPILAALYHLQGFEPALVMQLAIGTSLATIVFTSVSSSMAHHRRGAVRWPLVVQLSIGIALGGWLGGFLAVWLGGIALALMFGVFELLIAGQMFQGGAPVTGRAAPGGASNAAAGAVIGLVSALLGIGGGTLTVPWLTWHAIDIRTAVGTSAACGFPIALAGAAGFVLSGWNRPELPSGSSGFVYWPAVGAISVASVLAAPLGARLAHRLDRQHLRRVFAVFLAGLGLLMIGRALLT
jgi:uncharacterized membrane protein YfcA